jgi:hypothetical protein
MENTKAYFQAKDYWNNLSQDDREKILKDYNFWMGFKTYLYEYIPEDLKAVVMLKINVNDQLDCNTTMIF